MPWIWGFNAYEVELPKSTQFPSVSYKYSFLSPVQITTLPATAVTVVPSIRVTWELVGFVATRPIYTNAPEIFKSAALTSIVLAAEPS